MIVIYDNIIFSLQNAGGISNYWAELIKRIINKRVTIKFFEYQNSNIFRKKINISTYKESLINTSIVRYFPFLKKIPSKSIFHSSYYRVSLQKDIINITTVHDFVYEYYRQGLAKTVHNFQKSFAIKRSDGIICISNSTKKDLLKFYPLVDESKIKVIYNGVSEDFYPLENKSSYLYEKFDVLKNKRYIIYVGERSYYKNFINVIEIIKNISDLYLVVVSSKSFNEYEKEFMRGVENRVIFFKNLSNKELNILYNNSFCLLYPSSYEGFGLPVVEAMKAGCPVIALNKSSIPEVAGDAGILLPECKLDYFINSIRALENENFRLDLIQNGLKQAQKFSWDKCFEETWEFYNEIFRKKFG